MFYAKLIRKMVMENYEMVMEKYFVWGGGGSQWPTSLRRRYLLRLRRHGFDSRKWRQRKWTLGWPPAQKVPQ